MDGKVIRVFIYFFLAIIGIFLLFMTVNFFDNNSNNKVPGKKEEPKGMSISENLTGTAKYLSVVKPPVLPSEQGISSASLRSEGAIMLVREKNFNGVAERPKSMMAALNEMGSNKNKATIVLSDSDLNKKIAALAPPERLPRLNGAAMPEMGSDPGSEGGALISAPVDYKIFTSSEVWWSFANSRKLKPIDHDFSSSDLLILISVSDFPSDIFKIAGVEKSRKETVIKYRVDPQAMSARKDEDDKETFAGADVPRKGPPIRLQQVP